MSNFLPALSDSHTGFLSYLRDINDIPSLEKDEEYILAKRYSEDQDLIAAQKLVKSHLKLVAKIAMTFRNYGLPVVELVSEGNIGLMQAVKKFDPEKGFRLSTYAMWWIKAAIQEFILRSWSLVKIGTTAAQKKLFFNLGKAKRKISHAEGRSFNSSDYKQVAEDLNVSESEVAEMDTRIKQDRYLDEPASSGEDADDLINLIPAASASQETIFAHKQEIRNRKLILQDAMKQLNEREQYIINARKLNDKPSTLEELSIHFNVSKERVRQIEERALEKLVAFASTKRLTA